MITTAFRLVARGLPAAAAIALAGGCMTYDTRAGRQTQEREDFLILQESIRKLDGRIEALEMENRRLSDALNDARSQQDSGTAALYRTQQAQLEALQKRLADLEAARVRDQQELVATLSKKVADLIAASGGGGRATPRRSGNAYEHIVKPGETLSEIATAYGVKVSVIMTENNIKDPNQLRAGQTLYVPAP